MYVHNIDSVLFSLGPFQIRYYGIFYIIGIAITFLFLRRLAKERNLGLESSDILDLVVYLAIGMLVGSRIFYFLVYNFKLFAADPFEIFRLWHGGMSFHGGLLGASLAGYFFSKKKNISFFALADIVVVPLGLVLALGRIGNFINGELIGRRCRESFVFAVDFGDHVPRYPSQLFESFKNLIIFSVIYLMRKLKLQPGTLFFSFAALYSLLRFFVEFFRQPDPQLGLVLLGLSMGQVLSAITFFIAVLCIFLSEKYKMFK